MTETYWPRPSQPDRVERDPDRVAFLIPGLGYSAERPLLHFARAVFMRHGWTTQEVWWPERPPQREGKDLHVWFGQLRSFVHAHMSQVLGVEAAPMVALVGKSMGAFAAAAAADRGLSSIWLTPLLRDSAMTNDLRRSTAPFLLVGGTVELRRCCRRLRQPHQNAQTANVWPGQPGPTPPTRPPRRLIDRPRSPRPCQSHFSASAGRGGPQQPELGAVQGPLGVGGGVGGPVSARSSAAALRVLS
jgi:hypothetical protein